MSKQNSLSVVERLRRNFHQKRLSKNKNKIYELLIKLPKKEWRGAFQVEAQKMFRKISLTLHPDKGGNEKEYQALVSELEKYKTKFSQPTALDNFYHNKTPIEEVGELKSWLILNRGVFVSLSEKEQDWGSIKTASKTL